MTRAIHSPWLVALGVLALAALPVLAALAAHREQARRAEALLFERSAEVAAAQLQLLTSRQVGWQNGIRMRVSNRVDAPEKLMDELFAPGSSAPMLEKCRMFGYGALENGKVVLRWRHAQSSPAIAALGDDLLARSETTALLRAAMARPAQTVSEQRGHTLMTAMTVAGSSVRQPRGWLVAWWNLDAMCADPQLQLVNADHTLAIRPLDGDLLPAERAIDVGEGEAGWRIAVSKGAGFDALFPHVSERAIALTGGGCAVLLALLAGFATRAAGLRAALAAERELVGMKDHLLHSVSHEFRTPLSVILSSTELLETYDARLSPERRVEALTQIRHSTASMNELVGQVLLLSRIEARRVPVTPKPLDIAAFSRELAHEIETASHMRCPIEVTAPDNLEDVLDAELLRAVLGNLLSNGVKFSPGGAPVTFTVARDERLRFTIRDTGPGITSDDLTRVREPFFRSPSAMDTPGTGLGLTIADKCAALLGGALTLDSGPTGTTATLTV